MELQRFGCWRTLHLIMALTFQVNGMNRPLYSHLPPEARPLWSELPNPEHLAADGPAFPGALTSPPVNHPADIRPDQLIGSNGAHHPSVVSHLAPQANHQDAQFTLGAHDSLPTYRLYAIYVLSSLNPENSQHSPTVLPCTSGIYAPNPFHPSGSVSTGLGNVNGPAGESQGIHFASSLNANAEPFLSVRLRGNTLGASKSPLEPSSRDNASIGTEELGAQHSDPSTPETEEKHVIKERNEEVGVGRDRTQLSHRSGQESRQDKVSNQEGEKVTVKQASTKPQSELLRVMPKRPTVQIDSFDVESDTHEFDKENKLGASPPTLESNLDESRYAQETHSSTASGRKNHNTNSLGSTSRRKSPGENVVPSGKLIQTIIPSSTQEVYAENSIESTQIEAETVDKEEGERSGESNADYPKPELSVTTKVAEKEGNTQHNGLCSDSSSTAELGSKYSLSPECSNILENEKYNSEKEKSSSEGATHHSKNLLLSTPAPNEKLSTYSPLDESSKPTSFEPGTSPISLPRVDLENVEIKAGIAPMMKLKKPMHSLQSISSHTPYSSAASNARNLKAAPSTKIKGKLVYRVRNKEQTMEASENSSPLVLPASTVGGKPQKEMGQNPTFSGETKFDVKEKYDGLQPLNSVVQAGNPSFNMGENKSTSDLHRNHRQLISIPFGNLSKSEKKKKGKTIAHPNIAQAPDAFGILDLKEPEVTSWIKTQYDVAGLSNENPMGSAEKISLGRKEKNIYFLGGEKKTHKMPSNPGGASQSNRNAPWIEREILTASIRQNSGPTQEEKITTSPLITVDIGRGKFPVNPLSKSSRVEMRMTPVDSSTGNLVTNKGKPNLEVVNSSIFFSVPHQLPASEARGEAESSRDKETKNTQVGLPIKLARENNSSSAKKMIKTPSSPRKPKLFDHLPNNMTQSQGTSLTINDVSKERWKKKIAVSKKDTSSDKSVKLESSAPKTLSKTNIPPVSEKELCTLESCQDELIGKCSTHVAPKCGTTENIKSKENLGKLPTIQMPNGPSSSLIPEAVSNIGPNKNKGVKEDSDTSTQVYKFKDQTRSLVAEVCKLSAQHLQRNFEPEVGYWDRIKENFHLNNTPKDPVYKKALETWGTQTMNRFRQKKMNIRVACKIGAAINWDNPGLHIGIAPIDNKMHEWLHNAWILVGEEVFGKSLFGVASLLPFWEGKRRVQALLQVIHQSIAAQNMRNKKNFFTRHQFEVFAQYYGLSDDKSKIFNIPDHHPWKDPQSKLFELAFKNIEDCFGTKKAQGRSQLKAYVIQRQSPYQWWEAYNLESETNIYGLNVLKILIIGDALQFGFHEWKQDQTGIEFEPNKAFSIMVTILFDETSPFPWFESPERNWLHKLPGNLYKKHLSALSQYIYENGVGNMNNPFSIEPLKSVFKYDFIDKDKYRLGYELLWHDDGLPLERLFPLIEARVSPFEEKFHQEAKYMALEERMILSKWITKIPHSNTIKGTWKKIDGFVPNND